MKIDNDKRIFVTSDTHFCHDKEFIWKARGFESIDDMNEKIIENWNTVVGKDDIVIHLGDAMLGNTEKGIECMKRLNGKILLAFGNHDTDNRITEYAKLPNVELIGYSNILKYKKIPFYLSHYPTMTSNMEDNPSLKAHVTNLYGHTHQVTNFYNEIPFMYHVGMDSHNCTPVLLEDIISEITEKIKECEEQL